MVTLEESRRRLHGTVDATRELTDLLESISNKQTQSAIVAAENLITALRRDDLPTVTPAVTSDLTGGTQDFQIWPVE